MQDISIIKVDPTNKIVDRCEVNFAPFRICIFEVNEKQKKYVWLDTIEPYGDTYFNNLQSKYVIKELQLLKDDIRPEDISKVDKIIEFMNELGNLYNVKFVGD